MWPWSSSRTQSTVVVAHTSECRSASLSLHLRSLKALLLLIPPRWKPALYNYIVKFPRISTEIHPTVYRLPPCLVLKITYSTTHVEAAALRFISSVKGIFAPHLIDEVSTQAECYLVTTWVEGDCVSHVWDRLSPSDKQMIVDDLSSQLQILRSYNMMSVAEQTICNAAGGPVNVPRIPWVARKNPRTFSTCQEFARQVWVGLDKESNQTTLKPLIERDHIPIVFTHGDIVPRNLIFIGGLERWRDGRSRICLIDWEFSGWLPLYWEALKASFLEFKVDGDWLQMVRQIFPECSTELDADWEWRSRSKVSIL